MVAIHEVALTITAFIIILTDSDNIVPVHQNIQ